MKSPWQQRRSGRLCSGKRGPFPQCAPPTPRPAPLQGVPSRRTGTRLGPRPPLSSPSTAPPSSGAGLVVPDTRGVWVCTPGVGEGGRRVGVCRAVPKAQHWAQGSANVFILNLATALGSGDPPRSLCRDGDAVQSAGGCSATRLNSEEGVSSWGLVASSARMRTGWAAAGAGTQAAAGRTRARAAVRVCEGPEASSPLVPTAGTTVRGGRHAAGPERAGMGAAPLGVSSVMGVLSSL